MDIVQRGSGGGGGVSNPNPNCLRHLKKTSLFSEKYLVSVQEPRGEGSRQFVNVQIKADSFGIAFLIYSFLFSFGFKVMSRKKNAKMQKENMNKKGCQRKSQHQFPHCTLTRQICQQQLMVLRSVKILLYLNCVLPLKVRLAANRPIGTFCLVLNRTML